jgi:hypothetical protein
MHCRFALWLLLLWAGVAVTQPLPVSEGRQRVAWQSGEAWAMRHAAAATLPTGFGPAPELPTWSLALSGELGSIPHLSRAEQRVGLGGSKQEDLNQAPAFGRLRGWLGLPGGVVADLGWTPPLRYQRTRAEGLWTLGLGRAWPLATHTALGLRLFAQRGAVRGDITCPAEVVGADALNNPFRCAAPSRDRLDLDLHGIEGSLARQLGARRLHFGAGWLRYTPEVQIDANLTQYIERIQLYSDGELRYLSLGASQPFGQRQEIAVELLYVPLSVRREPARERANDAFWSLRLQWRWRP